MKVFKIYHLLIFMLSFAFLANVGQVDSVESASFPNGGFETFPSGGLNDWTWPSSYWTWDGSIAHSGTRSARVSRNSGLDTASLWSAYVPILPSNEYSLIYWLRTANATWYPRVVLWQYDINKNFIGTYLVAYANIGNGNNDWKAVNYLFQTRPDAAYLRLRIYLDIDTSGTFWFDDFSLNDGGPALFPFQTGFPVLATGAVWLSSPTVADINQDGNNELLIGAGNAVNVWTKLGIPISSYRISSSDRYILAQIAIADLDKDNRMEIVAGTRALELEGQCRVFAWNDDGSLMSGWPKSVDWNPQYSNSNCWITSVVLADIDGDNDLEIVASTTNNGAAYPTLPLDTPNLYAWHTDGSLVSGWPNQQTTAGIYGAVAVGDLLGDGKANVVVGRDYLYLNAYASNGISLPGWPIRTFVNRNDGDYNTEQRIEFSVNAPIIADLDGDGNMEIIVAGHVKGPGNVDVKLNSALLVLEPDGIRRSGWESAALGNGILEQVDLPWQAPAVADLNHDGDLEIIIATEDGWIRAYQADKSIIWAFNYTQGSKIFATDPVVGDIDGDGEYEILFGTYVPEILSSDKDGPVRLWALKSNGSVMHGFPLIVPTPGMRAAPTLADLDGDGDLEILAATRSGQVFVWDTSTLYDPTRMPWPIGRHDLHRTATYKIMNPLEASQKSVSQRYVNLNDVVTFTISLVNKSLSSETVIMIDTIPNGITYVSNSLIVSPSGGATITGNVINWNGTIPGSSTVEIIYKGKVSAEVPKVITNSAKINEGTNIAIVRSATIYANFISIFLPLLSR
ncbi:MAG: FG-GAP-like repeat-containing protein [Anaerolineaceae bacterium]|nr:FG-GAP-like repeat-containing protein [Anaerolineaceae bacterium]